MFRTTVGYVSVYRLRVSPTNHVSTSDILCPHDVAKTACYVRAEPNISGSFGYDGYGLMNFGKGAFAMSTKQPKTFGEGQYYDSYDTSFSAKRSSSTYGAASTVQPSSMRLVPCIKA